MDMTQTQAQPEQELLAQTETDKPAPEDAPAQEESEGAQASHTQAPDEQQASALELKERVGVVEAILFVAGDAVEKEALRRALDITEEALDETLDALESGYDFDRRGLRLLRFGAHVQLATRPDYAPYVERLLQPVQKQTLSQAVMETLAVIAYRQPVTKGEIEQVRGVKCDYSVQMLVSRGLIEEIGRKETLGRPILYGTTDAFLRHFCLGSLSELPQIDFSRLAGKLAKADGEDALPEHEGAPSEPETDPEDAQAIPQAGGMDID